MPERAVINPTASTFLTSSYVNVPPIDTLPLNTPSPITLIPVFVVSKRFVLLKYKS